MRTRFAPSPTGFLHIGGARTALFSWALARKEGGAFVLRIEDTDPSRSRPEFEEAIYEDLSWLGIDWDEGPDKGGPFSPYRQSERKALYLRFFEILREQGYVYPCFCTPEELEEERKKAISLGRPPRYSRRCLELSPKEREAFEREGRKPSWRFLVPVERTVVFSDLIRGEVGFPCDALTDFIILRADGIPTYNFACVVDDALMGITHVLRGEEHLSNTPYQILLYEALGFHPPLFAHVPIILSKEREKLSKRRGDASIRALREEGFLRDAIFNYLFTLGHSFPEGEEILPREKILAHFDLERIGKSSAVFDPSRLSWMNSVYLRKLPPGELQKALESFASSSWEGWKRAIGEERLLRLLSLFQEEATTLKDIALGVSQCLEEEGNLPGEGDGETLSHIHSLLQAIPENLWEEERLKEVLRNLQKGSNIPPRIFYRTLRSVILGREEGQEVYRLLGALGREKVLEKIGKTLRRARNGDGNSSFQHSHP
ncbi:MAG: glutamate--tRNA ligase [Candidatus Caldatribacteriaceae bacterium]